MRRNDAFTATYAGNFGYDEVITNPFINPTSGTFEPTSGTWISAGVPRIGGIGTAPINQNYGKVTAFTNNGHSSYNALQVNLRHNGPRTGGRGELHVVALAG